MSAPVAIKTMIDVTKDNVKAFRREILLTSTLRHPNIVNFVGACWSKELVCLVLEWAPRGSLADLLETPSLRWEDPLLKMAQDVSRGMVYLHGREFFDDETGALKQCIIHRDLKPDNALISEFSSCKLTDFGTSRARDLDVTMTSIGTPLFAAPEIMRGEHYSESVDVYSFGLVLLDIATEGSLLDFIGERWRVANGKKKAPKQPMRMINSIQEGWRPVTTDEPIGAGAPITVSAMVIRCCAHTPAERPTFEEVLAELSSGACAVEITGGSFQRFNHPLAEVIPHKQQGQGSPKSDEDEIDATLAAPEVELVAATADLSAEFYSGELVTSSLDSQHEIAKASSGKRGEGPITKATEKKKSFSPKLTPLKTPAVNRSAMLPAYFDEESTQLAEEKGDFRGVAI